MIKCDAKAGVMGVDFKQKSFAEGCFNRIFKAI